ncbi:tetratricopeptide repeat protein [Synechococcus elongatus]|uniref:TPR repeat n=2 Tax=Synechococcus elongatus TaxID=32046 RepID=Q31PR3_SYNE7|nr:tetratricopeptide repeat protein [Synechococcus elongatus]ABB56956.1 conserved hypothetical protein [Synechococcus elongatus PCC 7942 = FACHB-805]AJD58520.1 hypothetical protein M744_12085 [Synechococcus elongatus UTEX 2973]MBD2587359.1 tetratricopeptide repeat protein [Synechococcus elongatus FACHB-242]MBD2688862.1 tetratricopeptide repeat protein [Synechococcus elongatus FACHB-1061]MBD2707933.1 tetratricopeptide repeat protein [Synechococcus elongatus PCC 7942 = FACHB-805]
MSGQRWMMGGTIALWLLGATPGIAQTPTDPDTGAPIPRAVLLDLTTGPNDPLLPSKLPTRGYTPLEKRAIREAIAQLLDAADGAANLQQDDLAFELRFRAIRLRQVLGLEEELPLLKLTGQQARTKNRSDEGQAIAKRLQQIEATTPDLSPAQQLDLAIAYREVRDFDNAIRLYRQLLTRAQAPSDRRDLLDALATCEFESFRYAAAAETYGALVALLTDNPLLDLGQTSQVQQARLGPRQEPSYSQREWAVRQQIFSLEQIQRYAEAIAIQQAELALIRPDLQPAWLLAIAANQQRSRQLVLAVETYQTVYRQALPLGQLAIARDALEALRDLYQEQNQTADAIAVYDLLLAQARNEGDLYGLMENYARLGRYQLRQGDRPAAEQALTQGQSISGQLGFVGPELTTLQTQLSASTPAQ